METTPRQLPPKITTRLLWWFGIYLAGPFPIILHNPHGGLLIVFIFPLLLGNLAAIPLTMLPAGGAQVFVPAVLGAGWSLAYGVYLLHFIITLRTRTRRQFNWLLLILVTLVLLNQLMTHAIGQISG